MKKIITVKTAIMVIERPHSENPQGKSEKHQIELLDGETLTQAEKRYQNIIAPKKYQWITENGLHKYVCTNFYKIPLVVNSYYGPTIQKEVEVEAKDVKCGDQISVFDYLEGKIQL